MTRATAAESETTVTAVPNWIARARVFGRDIDKPIVSWRATKTQVVVTAEGETQPRRFYLETLCEVGSRPSDPRTLCLVAPDDRELLAARVKRATSSARLSVLRDIERQLLQDSNADDDPGALLEKLSAIRDSVNTAMASLEPLL